MLHLDNIIPFLRSIVGIVRSTLGIDSTTRAFQRGALMPIKVQHDDMDMRRNITERCAVARRRMYDDE